MEEFKVVMKKHDIGGVVLLQDGLGHSEYGKSNIGRPAVPP